MISFLIRKNMVLNQNIEDKKDEHEEEFELVQNEHEKQLKALLCQVELRDKHIQDLKSENVAMKM